MTTQHITKSHICKEEVVSRVLAQRGERPGLMHIISAMEACDTDKPWHDKPAGKTYLRPESGKCLHYYFRLLAVQQLCGRCCRACRPIGRVRSDQQDCA